MSRWLPKDTRDSLPERIASLRREGLDNGQIAKRMGIARTRVDYHWKRYKEMNKPIST